MFGLHIYGQDAWHDEVWIAGTPGELIVLKDAIEALWAWRAKKE